MILSNSSFSQNVKPEIIRGNKAYKENKFDEAENAYKDALKNSDKNVTAAYNLGNTLYRKDSVEEAAKAYDNTINNATDNVIKQKAFYNKGVAYQKAKKLPECILAYKNALILNPNDEDARQNLQRALKEQQQQNKKEDKDKKQQPQKNSQNKDNQKNQEPKPLPSKISKQDAEEKLKSLMENEKALQDKLHKIKGQAPNSPEKDW
jgi:tetratricopeptide (TPR) repeat protein